MRAGAEAQIQFADAAIAMIEEGTKIANQAALDGIVPGENVARF